jgi:hypothetical protein
MKKPLLICLAVISCIFSFAQETEKGRIDSTLIPRPFMHFREEFSFDAPTDNEKWANLQPGLHAAFGSTDKTFFRTEVPSLDQQDIWTETGWKGERLNIQIATWAPDSLKQVRIILHDLKSTAGDIIAKRHFTANIIKYVLSNYPYDAREVSCGEGPVDRAYLLPDRFEPLERFDLPGRTVRPIWLALNVPRDAKPGVYAGKIEVKTDKESIVLNLKIKVQRHVLPEPRHWTFRLDLWQNPWVIAEYYKVKPWSTAHMLLLEQHLKQYADAGGKYITTYAVHSPWADNSYMIEGSMIEWIKQKNGRWKFDYRIFDQYVQLAMRLGIDKAITIYTPIPWGERFRYLDEVTGNYVTERWLPVSDTFKTNWHLFLTDLKIHLEQKGWFDKTYLGINENAMEQTLAAIRVLKQHSKRWKITYAGDWHPVLDSLLDDYSCVYGKEPTEEAVKKRTVRKATSTYYVCCTPPKPNTFVFSPPVEGRWLGWYAMAYGYDGLLRWAYDAWPADPTRDARHVFWGAGDCFMIYPGGNSSIRFEKMREGIVDYEKINILKKKAVNALSTKDLTVIRRLNSYLRRFVEEKAFKEEKLQADINEGKRIIEEISDHF